jgi:hypothetical protein
VRREAVGDLAWNGNRFSARRRQRAQDRASSQAVDGGWSRRARILEFARKQSRNHMDTQFCFLSGANCRIGAEIATAPLADSNQIAATCRKPAAVTSSSENFPVALDVARKEPAEMALLPIIEVAFTVGGPLVNQRPSDQFA